jgi:hypothetical protein
VKVRTLKKKISRREVYTQKKKKKYLGIEFDELVSLQSLKKKIVTAGIIGHCMSSS